MMPPDCALFSQGGIFLRYCHTQHTQPENRITARSHLDSSKKKSLGHIQTKGCSKSGRGGIQGQEERGI